MPCGWPQITCCRSCSVSPTYENVHPLHWWVNIGDDVVLRCRRLHAIRARSTGQALKWSG